MDETPVIDAHAHLDCSTPETMRRDFERYERLMDGIDLRGALVMGGSIYTIDFFPENESLFELAERAPWVYPIINFDPPNADDACIAALERWLEQGLAWAVKFYPGYDPFHPSRDPWCREVLSVLERLPVPLIIHTGDTVIPEGRLSYSHPIVVDDLAVDHPSIDIVMAHIGTPFHETATAVLRKNPNVYADGSGLFYSQDGQYADDVFTLALQERFRLLFAQLGSSRMIHFGGDFPFTNPVHHLHFWRRFCSDFFGTDEAVRRFVFDNARTLFKLPLQ